MMQGVLPLVIFLYGVSYPVFLVDSAKSDHPTETGESIKNALTDIEKRAVASVDGDPDFIVGVQGVEQPLCFRLEGEAGHVVRLLQDPDTGVVVNARISRPIPGSRKTYLGAVLIARRNFRVVAKVGRVHVNRYRFPWGPVTLRLVHGHRVLIAPTLLALTLRNKNVTLVVKRHLPEANGHRDASSADTDMDDGEDGEFADNASTLSWAGRGTDLDRGPRPHGDDASVSADDPSRVKGQQNDGGRSPSHKRRRRGHGQRRRGRRRNRQGKKVSAKREGVRGITDAGDPIQDEEDRPSAEASKVSAMTLQRERRRAQELAADESSSSSRRSSRRRRPATDEERDAPEEDSTPGSQVTSGPPQEAAYVGFYVADARDLSPETHGLLGQFLHKSVELQRVRRKSNGVMKARLLVRRPRPHHVKATLRTRANLALNTSSVCWWLKDGGWGVVDGTYADYLVPRFRATDILPLQHTLMSQ